MTNPFKKLVSAFSRRKNKKQDTTVAPPTDQTPPVSNPPVTVQPPAPAAPSATEIGAQGQPDAVRTTLESALVAVLEHDRLEHEAYQCLMQLNDPSALQKHDAGQVAVRAQKPEADMGNKIVADLYKGVLQAYEEGRSDNLKAFTEVFASALLKLQYDRGFRLERFCREDIYPLVTKSATPADTLKWFAGAVGADAKERFVGNILARACREKNLALIGFALDAGAEPYRSRAVYAAVMGLDEGVLRLLHSRGVDITQGLGGVKTEIHAAVFGIRQGFQIEDKMSGFAKQAEELTAKVAKLEAEAAQRPPAPPTGNDGPK